MFTAWKFGKLECDLWKLMMLNKIEYTKLVVADCVELTSDMSIDEIRNKPKIRINENCIIISHVDDDVNHELVNALKALIAKNEVSIKVLEKNTA